MITYSIVCQWTWEEIQTEYRLRLFLTYVRRTLTFNNFLSCFWEIQFTNVQLLNSQINWFIAIGEVERFRNEYSNREELNAKVSIAHHYYQHRSNQLSSSMQSTEIFPRITFEKTIQLCIAWWAKISNPKCCSKLRKEKLDSN